MNEQTADEPLSTGDVAAMFGVTMTTVKRWADAGTLPFFRTVGGHYRFYPADVARLKDSQTGVAPSSPARR